MLASPLERFSRAIVRDQDLPLRIRIFRLVCAVVAVLCLVVVAPANLFQNLPLGVNLANILLGLFGGFFYWESCRGRHHVVAFLLIAVVMLDVTWFWNAGSQGSITYYYFPLLLFVLGLFRGRAQWILTVGLVLNVAALFVVESRFPGLVTPFQSPTDRILDHLTGIVCSVVAAAAMASVILAGYDREHQTLRASEERFRALAALSPDIISIFDREGRLTFNSAAARKIHGYRPEELQGRSTFELIHPEDRPSVQAAFAAALKDPATPVRVRYRYRNADGSYTWMEAAGSNELGNSNLQGVIAISRDISDRVHAEAALRDDEQRYRMLFAANPHAMLIYDVATLRILEVNDAVVAHYGYTRDEFLALTIRDIRPPDEVPRLQAYLNRSRLPIEQSSRWLHRVKSGEVIVVDIASHEISWGGHQARLVLIDDVTLRVRAEEALRDSENRYRLLFAANPHPMMIFDLETLRFLEVNTVAVELYGYSRDEFLARTIRDIRPPEDLPRFGPVLERLNVNSAGGRVPGTWRHLLKSGRIIDVEIVAHRLEWAGRPAHVVLVHDVTERLKLETKLRETQKLESLGVLAGGIAHDFNNLLTAILGNASLAALDVAADSPLGESFRLIEESARRAAELCRQMLAYSGKGRFAIRPVELSAFVKSTVDLLRISIARNCRLLLELSSGLPLIEADTAQLQQVVMNLVINAAEALGEPGGTIRLATRLQHADHALLETMYLSPNLAEGGYLVLEVTDSGCGMSPETRARIFDPFFTTKFTGRGLGLAAVLGIVRGHRGAIRVDSQLGTGTTFTLLFPATTTTTLPATGPATAPVTLARAPARTILVVDDEPSVRATARAALERYGFHVLLATDGVDGVAQFRDHHHEIAAVLLDLLMPRLGGDGAFREIRAIDPAARVLLMSGLDENEETQRFAGLGLAGFVQKPFTAQTLMSKIDAVLANGTS